MSGTQVNTGDVVCCGFSLVSVFGVVDEIGIHRVN